MGLLSLPSLANPTIAPSSAAASEANITNNNGFTSGDFIVGGSSKIDGGTLLQLFLVGAVALFIGSKISGRKKTKMRRKKK